MSEQPRRTIGSDEELRVLGELAVLTGRIDFLVRELLIALLDPTAPEVGVAVARTMSFDQRAGKAGDLLAIRFPGADTPAALGIQALARARDTMNSRNRYLHSRFHWDFDDPEGSGPTIYTHHGGTGENRAERVSPEQLNAVADDAMKTLAIITTTLHVVTQSLNIEQQYWERVYRADIPAGPYDTDPDAAE